MLAIRWVDVFPAASIAQRRCEERPECFVSLEGHVRVTNRVIGREIRDDALDVVVIDCPGVALDERGTAWRSSFVTARE